MLDALDVAIGISFYFLLVSVIVTAATEILELIWKHRGEFLAKGIRALLQEETGDAALTKAFYRHPLIRPLYEAQNLGSPTGWFGKARAWVRGLFAAGRKKKRSERGIPEDLPEVLPSYIPARTFALALLDLAGQIRESGLDDAAVENRDRLNGVLAPLLKAAGTAIDEQVASIELWYNDVMSRITGWYKRHAQVIALWLGVAIAFGLNADTITVVRALSTDDDLREAYVAAAEAYVERAASEAAAADSSETASPASPALADTTASPPDSARTAPAADSLRATPSDSLSAAVKGYREAVDDLKGLGLPLGWERSNPAALWPLRLTVEEADALEAYCRRTFQLPCATANNDDAHADQIREERQALLDARDQPPSGCQNLWWWLAKLFGVLLTGVAVSLGAPFWFDLLDRFMVVRSTLKPSEKGSSTLSDGLRGSLANQTFLRAELAGTEKMLRTDPDDGPIPSSKKTPGDQDATNPDASEDGAADAT